MATHVRPYKVHTEQTDNQGIKLGFINDVEWLNPWT